MYHPIVKEQVNPGQLEGLQTNPDTIEPCPKCQAVIHNLFCAKSVEIFAAVDFLCGTPSFRNAASDGMERHSSLRLFRVLRVCSSSHVKAGEKVRGSGRNSASRLDVVAAVLRRGDHMHRIAKRAQALIPVVLCGMILIVPSLASAQGIPQAQDAPRMMKVPHGPTPP
jgi:hypothetical protein